MLTNLYFALVVWMASMHASANPSSYHGAKTISAFEQRSMSPVPLLFFRVPLYFSRSSLDMPLWKPHIDAKIFRVVESPHITMPPETKSCDAALYVVNPS